MSVRAHHVIAFQSHGNESEFMNYLRISGDPQDYALVTRYFEPGTFVLRRANGDEVKASVEKYRESTTRLQREFCDRRVLLLKFGINVKPWVVCPALKCMIAAKTKLKCRTLFLQYSSQQSDMIIPHHFLSAFNATQNTTEHLNEESDLNQFFIPVTFCPQQKYTEHTPDWFRAFNRGSHCGGDMNFPSSLYPMDNIIVISDASQSIRSCFRFKATSQQVMQQVDRQIEVHVPQDALDALKRCCFAALDNLNSMCNNNNNNSLNNMSSENSNAPGSAGLSPVADFPSDIESVNNFGTQPQHGIRIHHNNNNYLNHHLHIQQGVPPLSSFNHHHHNLNNTLSRQQVVSASAANGVRMHTASNQGSSLVEGVLSSPLSNINFSSANDIHMPSSNPSSSTVGLITSSPPSLHDHAPATVIADAHQQQIQDHLVMRGGRFDVNANLNNLNHSISPQSIDGGIDMMSHGSQSERPAEMMSSALRSFATCLSSLHSIPVDTRETILKIAHSHMVLLAQDVAQAVHPTISPPNATYSNNIHSTNQQQQQQLYQPFNNFLSPKYSSSPPQQQQQNMISDSASRNPYIYNPILHEIISSSKNSFSNRPHVLDLATPYSHSIIQRVASLEQDLEENQECDLASFTTQTSTPNVHIIDSNKASSDLRPISSSQQQAGDLLKRHQLTDTDGNNRQDNDDVPMESLTPIVVGATQEMHHHQSGDSLTPMIVPNLAYSKNSLQHHLCSKQFPSIISQNTTKNQNQHQHHVASIFGNAQASNNNFIFNNISNNSCLLSTNLSQGSQNAAQHINNHFQQPSDCFNFGIPLPNGGSLLGGSNSARSDTMGFVFNDRASSHHTAANLGLQTTNNCMHNSQLTHHNTYLRTGNAISESEVLSFLNSDENNSQRLGLCGTIGLEAGLLFPVGGDSAPRRNFNLDNSENMSEIDDDEIQRNLIIFSNRFTRLEDRAKANDCESVDSSSSIASICLQNDDRHQNHFRYRNENEKTIENADKHCEFIDINSDSNSTTANYLHSAENNPIHSDTVDIFNSLADIQDNENVANSALNEGLSDIYGEDNEENREEKDLLTLMAEMKLLGGQKVLNDVSLADSMHVTEANDMPDSSDQQQALLSFLLLLTVSSNGNATKFKKLIDRIEKTHQSSTFGI